MKDITDANISDKNWNKKRLQKQLLVVTFSTIGVYLGFKYGFPLLFPFILAYLLAKMILPMVRFLKKNCHLPLMLGSIIALVITLGILGTGITYLFGILFKQFQIFISDLPNYIEYGMAAMERICSHCDRMLNLEIGTASEYIQENVTSIWGFIQNVIMPLMTEHTMNIVIGVIALFSVLLIIIIAIINIVVDYDEIRASYEATDLYRCISPVTSKLASVGYAYVKTQAIIMSINAAILVVGFYLIGSRYAWLAGIGIAVMDAFPVIGSGLFLLPLAVIKLCTGNMVHAIIIVILYALCEFIRSLIEPRLLGNRIGLKPIYTFMAMYVGVKLFGVVGFLVGPLALVIIKTIVEETMRPKQDNEKKENEE